MPDEPTLAVGGIPDVSFNTAMLKQLIREAGSGAINWKDASDIARLGIKGIERLAYALAGTVMRADSAETELTAARARIAKLEAALNLIVKKGLSEMTKPGIKNIARKALEP